MELAFPACTDRMLCSSVLWSEGIVRLFISVFCGQVVGICLQPKPGVDKQCSP